MKRFMVIITFGPALREQFENLSCVKYSQFEFFFRLNGAHVEPQQVQEYVDELRDHFEDPRILMDLPGSKLRTAGLTENIPFKAGVPFEFKYTNTNYPESLTSLKPGVTLTTHDSRYHFRIIETGPDSVILLPNISGSMENGKGIHVRGARLGIPFISEKDRALAEEAIRLRLWGLDFSYVRSLEDIDAATSLAGSHPIRIIPKIETAEAMENLQAILARTPLALVDRGDLAGEIGLENIPAAQSTIIEMAHWNSTAVVLATQFFTSMVNNPLPLIAELNDCHNCIRHGISGIQLSEETAIGQHVLKVLDVLDTLVKSAKPGMASETWIREHSQWLG